VTVRTFTSEPPHPVPDRVREHAHRYLDELLDRMGWDSSPCEHRLGWDYSAKATGSMRIIVGPEW